MRKLFHAESLATSIFILFVKHRRQRLVQGFQIFYLWNINELCFEDIDICYRSLTCRAICLDVFTNFAIYIIGFSVSFFGDSQVFMPLQEAKLLTNMRLRFRSHQENALLFLAPGRTDYCLMTLDGGRIKLNLKINDYQTEVSYRRAMHAGNRTPKVLMRSICFQCYSCGRRRKLILMICNGTILHSSDPTLMWQFRLMNTS